MKVNTSQLDKNRVVIAMSGGVDSSVAALLLKEQGYEVIGITLKLWEPPQGQKFKHTSCCSVEDITDARRVADQLGIPFYVINAKEKFRTSVVDSFVSEYLKGRTPNPCALCNQNVKFKDLLEQSFQLGAYHVATGHFVQKNYNEAKNIWELHKGVDLQKDQSYFLFSLSQERLEHSLFPVGHLTKSEVRAIAEKHGLKTQNKPESQEVCFVPGHHGDFIKQYLPDRRLQQGEFVDEQGKSLGEHQGIHHYTVGQRRGTQVSQGERVYIKKIDAQSGQIVLSSNESLMEQSLFASGVHWIGSPVYDQEVTVRIRYRHSGALAKVVMDDQDRLRVDFKEPQRAIAPGQAVVFYQGDQVLGGGWIERGLS